MSIHETSKAPKTASDNFEISTVWQGSDQDFLIYFFENSFMFLRRPKIPAGLEGSNMCTYKCSVYKMHVFQQVEELKSKLIYGHLVTSTDVYKVFNNGHKYFTFGNNYSSFILMITLKHSLFGSHIYLFLETPAYSHKYLLFGSHNFPHIYEYLSIPCLADMFI